MKAPIWLIAFLFLFQSSLYCQEKEKSFLFKGKVHAYGDELKGATIEVYNGGDLVYEMLSKAGGKFEFDLKAEQQYTVEISMENLRMKTIWINTKRTSQLKGKIPVFSFDVVLKKEKITRYDELSEIPVTLIKYQPKKGEFYMDKTYEQAVKSKKEKIKANTIDVR